MPRIFIGIATPAAWATPLQLISCGIDGVRWQKPENYHLTLVFIGEVEHPQLAELDALLAEFFAPPFSPQAFSPRPFSLQLAGVGHFESRQRPHTIWAGIAPNPALNQLQQKILGLVSHAGFMPERRNFTPHITLGRCQRANPIAIADFIQRNSLLSSQAAEISHIILYESCKSKDGRHYLPLARYHLTNSLPPR